MNIYLSFIYLVFFLIFRGLHNYLTSNEMLSHISFHIGTSELILCAVSIFFMKFMNSLMLNILF